MRPQLNRINADILCLQEVHGQETPGEPRRLLALNRVLANIPYAGYNQASTMTSAGDQVYDVRNLVVLSRFEIAAHDQFRHEHVPAPFYQKVMSDPAEAEAKRVTWERPILYAKLSLPDNKSIKKETFQ